MTLKQKKFIAAYLETGNATEAARRAGYSEPNTQGPRMLVNVGIRAEIDRLYRENCLSADEVLSRLSDQARGIAAFVETIHSHAAVVNVESMLAAGKGHLIKGIKWLPMGGCEIETYDAQAALVHIGRHHKLFTDKVEHAGGMQLPPALLMIASMDPAALNEQLREARRIAAADAGDVADGS